MGWAVEPVSEGISSPVALNEVKTHLRVIHDDEDLLIQQYIDAAVEDAELFTGRAIKRRTLRLVMDRFPRSGIIHLPFPPVRSVEEVAYIDSQGMEHVISAANYVTDLTDSRARIAPVAGYTWPVGVTQSIGGVHITYEAGYDEGLPVPVAIRQAILLTVGHFYEHREAVTTERAPEELPLGVKHLLTKGRVFIPMMDG